MIEYLTAGGPVMIPIGLCSIIALATFLERLWSLRSGRVVPRAFAVQLMELVKQRRWDDALTLCKSNRVAAARVCQAALEVRTQSRALIKERLEEVGRREAAEMERYIPILGTIASIAPLLGLLGTVGGMILTFSVIQDEGLGNVGSLAGWHQPGAHHHLRGALGGHPGGGRQPLRARSGRPPAPAARGGQPRPARAPGRSRRRGQLMRFGVGRRADPVIDVTPMIDIVFQLVLFFMVSTTFISSPAIQVDLPRSSAQVVMAKNTDINIWMTTEGAVYVDNSPVTETQLDRMLRRAAETDPNTLVVIKADTGVAHGRVVTVMDLARSIGLSRLAIATEVEEEL